MKKRSFSRIWVAAIAVASSVGAPAARADRVEQGVKDAAASGLLAGVARADITPPVGIAQLNWGSQTHVEAVGIDPAGMLATALVLSDGQQRFAMVGVDTISVAGLEGAIDRAASLTGIPPAHIRLAASHTHAGPQVSRVRGPARTDYSRHEAVFQTYGKVLIDKTVGAIVQANADLRPVHLHGAHGAGTINMNRRVRAAGGLPAAVGRNPEGFVDRDLAVVRVDDARGKPLAIIVNYACHGTVMGFENNVISPDWIGPMRNVVERALPGARCLFFQGAAGNQGPVEGFTGDLSVAHRLGSVLGHQAAAIALGVDTVRREPRFEGFVESTAYQAKQPWRVLGPRDAMLEFATRIIEVPRRKYSADDLDEIQRLVSDARAKLKEAEGSGEAWQRHQANARLRRFSDLLRKWQLPYDPTPIPIQVQILRIGEVAIVAMPGEPFAEIGAAIRKASPFSVTMVCGYSSGAGGGYMPVRSEYGLGGYEVQMTPYAPEAADKLVRETIQLYDAVR
jgi:hypothetical protein